MKKIKNFFYKILYPNIVITILFVISSSILLAYTFLTGDKKSTVAYISYIFSAYSLTIIIACSVRIIPVIINFMKKIAYKNIYINEYITDIHYRTKFSLYASLLVNLFYAIVKIFLGYIYHSVWLGSVAVYYVILSILRFMLLHSYNRDDIDKNMALEYKKYRLCSILLILLNVSLGGMVTQIVLKNTGYQYPGHIIYIAAMYTFYAVSAAIVNLIKYRKYDSPILSASKVINFTTVLVSVLSLQTAMLTQFYNSSVLFRQSLNAITGISVCFIILITAIYMFINATIKINRIIEYKK